MNQPDKNHELSKDLEHMVLHAEALIKASANTGIEKMDEIRNKAEQSIKIIKAKLVNSQNSIFTQSKASIEAGDAYVHENPWRSIGFAISVGTIIGLFISRR